MEVRNQQILNCLQQGQSFAVATIMSQSGSTPGTSGSKMIVKQDRTVCGTIGGGVVEARVIGAYPSTKPLPKFLHASKQTFGPFCHIWGDGVTGVLQSLGCPDVTGFGQIVLFMGPIKVAVPI